MPFDTTLETIPRDVRVPMASISYERKGKKLRCPQLLICIPSTLSGLCKRDRFRFELGTGADAGKARISALAKGVPGTSAPGAMLKTHLRIAFGAVPSLGDDAAAKDFCAVRKIDDNTWEIDLPPWFKVETPNQKRK